MIRADFINELYSAFGMNPENVFAFGQEHGWLEYEDELFCNETVTRKQEARIIHMFILKEKGIKDIPDISRAEVLRDLYDCRVCANHVAQVYLRGIMDAKDLAVNGGFLLFDPDGTDDMIVIRETIRRTAEIVKIENSLASKG